MGHFCAIVTARKSMNNAWLPFQTSIEIISGQWVWVDVLMVTAHYTINARSNSILTFLAHGHLSDTNNK